MDRPYQFYYFVPLVTFWFVVIYGTLAMWPQILQKKANSRCQERELQMLLVFLQWKEEVVLSHMVPKPLLSLSFFYIFIVRIYPLIKQHHLHLSLSNFPSSSLN